MRLKVSVMAPAVAVLGLTAVYSARAWVERQVATRMESIPPARPAPVYGTIVVASASLPFGSELTPGSLREVSWPKDAPIEGSFSSIQQVLDGKSKRIVLSALQGNEPVLARKITGPGQRPNLSAVIDPDRKAITVRVDDVIGVAGFLQPGDRVDVLLTRKATQGAVADVVLQNLKLLGVDQTVDDKGAGKAAVARSVTLEVDTDQAQRLVVAQSVGSLTLVLRPIGAAQVESTRPVTSTDLLQESRSDRAAPRVTVGVIRNSARQDYSVPVRGQN